MSLSEQAITLQCLAHELMYLGTDGSPVYSDDLSRRNGEVYRLATALYASCTKGANPEETANICLALLMGYNTSFIDHGEKQEHMQQVLDLCWDILDALPPSLLKTASAHRLLRRGVRPTAGRRSTSHYQFLGFCHAFRRTAGGDCRISQCDG